MNNAGRSADKLADCEVKRAVSGNPKQKLKLLCLADLFYRKTDASHLLSMSDIIKHLMEFGIEAERKSIYRDIEVLRSYGMDIERGAAKKSGYYLKNPRFESQELTLLVDALQASPIISQRRTDEILEKLCAVAGEHQAEQMRRQLYGVSRNWPEGRRMLQSRVKTDDNEMQKNIATIHRAISQGKKIRFIYVHRTLKNNLPVYDTGREFIISPYALVWEQDKYYVVANYENYDDLSHYRIDRMKRVECTVMPARSISEVSHYRGAIDMTDYMHKVFNMFAGSESAIVELECDMGLLDAVVERFGLNVSYRQISDEKFRVRIRAILSEGFERWLLGFGGGIRVCSSESVAVRIKKRIADMLKQYE